MAAVTFTAVLQSDLSSHPEIPTVHQCISLSDRIMPECQAEVKGKSCGKVHHLDLKSIWNIFIHFHTKS